MVLLRHLLGDVLRRLRLRQGRTLREVSADARVSLGYLSEVERGQKEASSELLGAICTALGVPLSRVLREVSDGFALSELQNASVLEAPEEPALAGHSRRGLVRGSNLSASPEALLVEGPVPASEILRSRALHHEIIGRQDGSSGGQQFRDRHRRVDDIKDMIPV